MSCSVAKATFLVHVSVGRATSDLRIEKLTAVVCSIPRWYHFNIARHNLAKANRLTGGMSIGNHEMTIIDLLIIAIAIFIAVKAMNAAQKAREDEPQEEPAAPPELSAEEKLLTEIQALLAKNQS